MTWIRPNVTHLRTSEPEKRTSRRGDQTMSATALFGMQFTFSFVLSAIVAKWYVAPALNRLSVHAALVPLFLFHVLRYLPSTAFAPGQVDVNVPKYAMAAIAYGDLISAVLALIAAFFLRYRVPGAIG